MKKNILIGLTAISLFLAILLPAVAAPLGPTEQLRPTLDAIIKLLADPSLQGESNKKDRRDKIMTTIGTQFDFGEMSQRILGSTWNEINRYERDYFTKLMTQLLENNYIGQLEGYSGETVEYIGEKIKENRAQVLTHISRNSVKYPVHYIMIQKQESWMVYDINIEGVSLVNNYRAEFKSIIRKDKFEGLIKAIEDKNKAAE